MHLSSNIVQQRAHILARSKLIFDLLLATGFYLSGAPLIFLFAPAVDALLLWPYLRYLNRAPASMTAVTLTLSAALLALAPQGLGAAGSVLWVFYPLIPLGTGFVLGRRKLLWQTALITTIAAVAGMYPFLSSTGSGTLIFNETALTGWLVALVIAIWVTSWLLARLLSADPSSHSLLGEPLVVVRGVLLVPFNWVIGGLLGDALRLELQDLKRVHNPRWIVLDLAPAGDLGNHDINAIDQAAAAVSSPACTIVLARPPVDALGHLDFAQPIVGRVERFATLAQAVEAGLRRQGWTVKTEQAQRLVTHL